MKLNILFLLSCFSWLFFSEPFHRNLYLKPRFLYSIQRVCCMAVCSCMELPFCAVLLCSFSAAHNPSGLRVSHLSGISVFTFTQWACKNNTVGLSLVFAMINIFNKPKIFFFLPLSLSLPPLFCSQVKDLQISNLSALTMASQTLRPPTASPH